jgi:hypothetical protein
VRDEARNRKSISKSVDNGVSLKNRIFEICENNDNDGYSAAGWIETDLPVVRTGSRQTAITVLFLGVFVAVVAVVTVLHSAVVAAAAFWIWESKNYGSARAEKSARIVRPFP